MPVMEVTGPKTHLWHFVFQCDPVIETKIYNCAKVITPSITSKTSYKYSDCITQMQHLIKNISLIRFHLTKISQKKTKQNKKIHVGNNKYPLTAYMEFKR